MPHGVAQRVVILDFDGVVLESNAVKTEAFADVFARFPEHAEAMMAFHHANVSASRYLKFEHLVNERLGRPGDVSLRDELAAEFSRRTQERIATVPFVPGAEAFLAEFSARVPLYLASVTPAEDLEQTLARRDLRRFFRGVYGCPPWTKAGAVRDVLAREDCPPAAAVLVGDSNGDRRAADETGVEFVARDSGLPFDPPLQTAFRDLDAIADFLRRRLS
jgi:beta-phosphoglucomutase-like phosphatase (HAD superfamily)